MNSNQNTAEKLSPEASITENGNLLHSLESWGLSIDTGVSSEVSTYNSDVEQTYSYNLDNEDKIKLADNAWQKHVADRKADISESDTSYSNVKKFCAKTKTVAEDWQKALNDKSIAHNTAVFNAVQYIRDTYKELNIDNDDVIVALDDGETGTWCATAKPSKSLITMITDIQSTEPGPQNGDADTAENKGLVSHDVLIL